MTIGRFFCLTFALLFFAVVAASPIAVQYAKSNGPAWLAWNDRTVIETVVRKGKTYELCEVRSSLDSTAIIVSAMLFDILILGWGVILIGISDPTPPKTPTEPAKQ